MLTLIPLGNIGAYVHFGPTSRLKYKNSELRAIYQVRLNTFLRVLRTSSMGSKPFIEIKFPLAK